MKGHLVPPAPARRRRTGHAGCFVCLGDRRHAVVKRRVYQDELHIHFVTFSCYKRRQHLQHDVAKRVVIGELGSQLSKYDGSCLGFVVMHDHVHSLVWFPRSGQLSTFMNQWKTLTSIRLKQVLPSRFPKYWASIDASDPIWQSRYYGLNLWSWCWYTSI